MKYSVLFVCSANICRSPMAEGLLKGKVDGREDEWVIKSAGVWASPGSQAAINTRRVLKDRGVTMDDHHSQPVTLALIAELQLVLVMECHHKEALQLAFPEYTERIFLVTEMVGDDHDIIDPVGGSLADYEETAQELEEILSEGYHRILELARE